MTIGAKGAILQIDPESVEAASRAARGGEWWTYPGLLALGVALGKIAEKAFDWMRGVKMFKSDVEMKDAEIDTKISDNQRAFIDTLIRLHESERAAWAVERKSMMDQFAAERIVWNEDRKLMREEIVSLRARVAALESELHAALRRGDSTRSGL